jgi:hypothetical protein
MVEDGLREQVEGPVPKLNTPPHGVHVCPVQTDQLYTLGLTQLVGPTPTDHTPAA